MLAVIAVVSLLTALILPSIGAAQRSAERARTRVRFNQWAAAIESFRSEYGWYPAFHSSHLVNPPGQNPAPDSLHLFHDLLAARRRDGSVLPAVGAGTGSQDPEAQNRKLIPFCAFADSDFNAATAPTPNLLQDASGHTEIAVIVDTNLDGVIDAADCVGGWPSVDGLTPDGADIPTTGVRAGVIFYAPAPGATPANPSFVFSWK